MAIETEKKFKITTEQKEYVIEGLKDFNAEFIGEDFEVNLLFGGGIIEANKAVLRVRQTENKTLLTYKQAVKNFSGVKQHIEHEVEVSDPGIIREIIETLGFQLGMIYEKRRHKWKFENTEIVIDELPFGLYMEIEGEITDIAKIEMMLDLDDFEVEHATYPYLTKHLGVLNGDVIEAKFL